jgi:methylmalonyl-CoA mutase, C-terminal domain
VHNRVIITVAKMLRDSGMEVIYLGNALPEEIINIAIQESVDVIGVSSLGGAHLTLGKDLIDLAKQHDLKESVLFIIGGIFSIEDHEKLRETGFDEVFTAGATKEEIVSAINGLLVKA